MIMKVVKSDQSFLQFVLLRKVSTFDDGKETCLGNAEHQKMYSLPKGVTEKSSRVFELEHGKSFQGKDDEALDKMDILCKNFEDLALLITKSKPKPNIQDIICHKCKKAGYYASLCQIQTDADKVLQLLWKVPLFGSRMLKEADRRNEGQEPDPERAESPGIKEKSCSTCGAGEKKQLSTYKRM